VPPAAISLRVAIAEALAHAPRAVADVRLPEIRPHTPRENAPRLAASCGNAHRCRHAASSGVALPSGSNSNDVRSRAFAITDDAESLHSGRSRPVEGHPIKDDVRSGTLLTGSHRNARRCRRRGEHHAREQASEDDDRSIHRPNRNTAPIPPGQRHFSEGAITPAPGRSSCRGRMTRPRSACGDRLPLYERGGHRLRSDRGVIPRSVVDRGGSR
jgi:hypothetical protein